MKLFVIILSFLVSVSSYAIDIRNYRFHQMPETSYYGGINSVVKDTVGRIWFSGTDALFMFNGHSFENMAVSSPNRLPADYRKLVRDENGRIYVATSVGLYAFDYLRQEFSLSLVGDVGAIDPDMKGGLWLILNDNVIRYGNGGKEGAYPLPDTVRVSPMSLHLSCSAGNVYVGALRKL